MDEQRITADFEEIIAQLRAIARHLRQLHGEPVPLWIAPTGESVPFDGDWMQLGVYRRYRTSHEYSVWFRPNDEGAVEAALRPLELLGRRLAASSRSCKAAVSMGWCEHLHPGTEGLIASRAEPVFPIVYALDVLFLDPITGSSGSVSYRAPNELAFHDLSRAVAAAAERLAERLSASQAPYHPRRIGPCCAEAPPLQRAAKSRDELLTEIDALKDAWPSEATLALFDAHDRLEALWLDARKLGASLADCPQLPEYDPFDADAAATREARLAYQAAIAAAELALRESCPKENSSAVEAPASTPSSQLAPTGNGDAATDKPAWNPVDKKLAYRGSVVREFKRKSANVWKVLGEFQDSEWPNCVGSPLSTTPNKEQVRKTCETLNKGITLIRFAPDASGNGFSWGPVGDLPAMGARRIFP